MTRNIGTAERILRGLAGIGLIAFALLGGQTSYATYAVWGWLGLVPLATAVIGWCPPYALLGINTCGKAAKSGGAA